MPACFQLRTDQTMSSKPKAGAVTKPKKTAPTTAERISKQVREKDAKEVLFALQRSKEFTQAVSLARMFLGGKPSKHARTGTTTVYPGGGYTITGSGWRTASLKDHRVVAIFPSSGSEEETPGSLYVDHWGTKTTGSVVVQADGQITIHGKGWRVESSRGTILVEWTE